MEQKDLSKKIYLNGALFYVLILRNRSVFKYSYYSGENIIENHLNL